MNNTVNTGRQFMTFAGVGVMGTAAHYLTLIILVELVNLTPVIASSCGAIVGALVNYMLNYRFTFSSNIAHTKALTKFMIVASAGFVINLFIMWLFTSAMVFNYMIAQIIATGAVLTGSYTGNRIWTFKSS